VIGRRALAAAALASAVLAVWLGVTAVASDPGPAAASVPALVDQRQKEMRAVAEAAKLIAGMFENKRPYEGAAMLVAADTIARFSGATLVDAFPDGTLDRPSSALPAIAGERQTFAGIANDLERLARDLAAAVRKSPDVLGDDMRMGSDIVSMNPLFSARRKKAEQTAGAIPAEHLFHMMLQTCTSCHAKFRRPKE
jgi:cytochrome c556